MLSSQPEDSQQELGEVSQQLLWEGWQAPEGSGVPLGVFSLFSLRACCLSYAYTPTSPHCLKSFLTLLKDNLCKIFIPRRTPVPPSGVSKTPPDPRIKCVTPAPSQKTQ